MTLRELLATIFTQNFNLDLEICFSEGFTDLEISKIYQDKNHNKIQFDLKLKNFEFRLNVLRAFQEKVFDKDGYCIIDNQHYYKYNNEMYGPYKNELEARLEFDKHYKNATCAFNKTEVKQIINNVITLNDLNEKLKSYQYGLRIYDIHMLTQNKHNSKILIDCVLNETYNK